MPAPPRPVTTEASVPHSAAISVGGRRRAADAQIAEHDQIGAGVGLLVGDRHARGVRPASASSTVSASSTSIRPLPRRTRWRTTSSGSSSGSQSRPASTIRTGTPEPAGQHGDGARALQRGAHQLVRGAGRPAGDAQFGDPVITGEQHHARLLDRP